MMKKLLVIFLLASCSISVQAASFDCRKATYQEEKTVCNTPILSSLDDQMAKLYFEARKKTTDLNAFERLRINWILQKRTCESSVACLERSYLQRIAELEHLNNLNNVTGSSLDRVSRLDITQLDGEWYSNEWKYGYKLTNGVGIATSTNSPNFNVGDKIIFLKELSDNIFEGKQVYKDGKFYKIKVEKKSNNVLDFIGEKNVRWTMTRQLPTGQVNSGTVAIPYEEQLECSYQRSGTHITNLENGFGILNIKIFNKTGPNIANINFTTSDNKDYEIDSLNQFDPEDVEYNDNKIATWGGGIWNRTSFSINRKTGIFTLSNRRKDSEHPKAKEYDTYIETIYNGKCLSSKLITSETKGLDEDKNKIQNEISLCKGLDTNKWHMCIGKINYPNGASYWGEWKNGKRSGNGIYSDPEVGRYTGEFNEDAFEGEGVLTTKNGERIFGRWKSGKFLESIKNSSSEKKRNILNEKNSKNNESKNNVLDDFELKITAINKKISSIINSDKNNYAKKIELETLLPQVNQIDDNLKRSNIRIDGMICEVRVVINHNNLTCKTDRVYYDIYLRRYNELMLNLKQGQYISVNGVIQGDAERKYRMANVYLFNKVIPIMRQAEISLSEKNDSKKSSSNENTLDNLESDLSNIIEDHLNDFFKEFDKLLSETLPKF